MILMAIVKKLWRIGWSPAGATACRTRRGNPPASCASAELASVSRGELKLTHLNTSSKLFGHHRDPKKIPSSGSALSANKYHCRIDLATKKVLREIEGSHTTPTLKGPRMAKDKLSGRLPHAQHTTKSNPSQHDKRKRLTNAMQIAIAPPKQEYL